MRILIVFFAIIVLQTSANAQNFYAAVKGGVSEYEGVDFNISGASGDQHWANGTILSAGAGMRISSAFALEALVEYSTHNYAPRIYETAPINGSRNTITELTALGRFSILTISIIRLELVAGLSYSYQREGYPIIGEVSRTGVSVPLGLAVECQLTKAISVTLDGNLRMRFYVTPVAQIGLAYAL